MRPAAVAVILMEGIAFGAATAAVVAPQSCEVAAYTALLTGTIFSSYMIKLLLRAFDGDCGCHSTSAPVTKLSLVPALSLVGAALLLLAINSVGIELLDYEAFNSQLGRFSGIATFGVLGFAISIWPSAAGHHLATMSPRGV